MAKTMHGINLLPNRGDTVLIQFLNWALTIGRLLIILVETLALGTFLYRFSLDMQIVDKKDQIKVQQAFVTAYKSQEESYRNLQARLDLIKKYDAIAESSPKALSDIIELGKGYITFRSINVSNKVIVIEASAPTVAPLTAFVNSLKKYPAVKTISIDKVENKTSSAEIIVGISAYLTKDGADANSKGEQLQTDEPFSEN